MDSWSSCGTSPLDLHTVTIQDSPKTSSVPSTPLILPLISIYLAFFLTAQLLKSQSVRTMSTFMVKSPCQIVEESRTENLTDCKATSQKHPQLILLAQHAVKAGLLPSHVGYGDSQSFPHQWSFHNISLGHIQNYSHLSSCFNLSFQSQDLSLLLNNFLLTLTVTKLSLTFLTLWCNCLALVSRFRS